MTIGISCPETGSHLLLCLLEVSMELGGDEDDAVEQFLEDLVLVLPVRIRDLGTLGLCLLIDGRLGSLGVAGVL